MAEFTSRDTLVLVHADSYTARSVPGPSQIHKLGQLVRTSHTWPGKVAHALVRAVSRLVSIPSSREDSLSRPGVGMSDRRSLAGTSLAAETSAGPFYWIQSLAPRFLESDRRTPRRLVPSCRSWHTSSVRLLTRAVAQKTPALMAKELTAGLPFSSLGVNATRSWADQCCRRARLTVTAEAGSGARPFFRTIRDRRSW